MIEWLRQNYGTAVIAIVAIVVLWRLAGRLRRRRRLSRPVMLHPKLQKYGGSQQLGLDRRREAEKIVATSSTGEIAGYRVVEQVEAVFVDGFARPEEALEGLKAAAAMKGANALTNVRQERSSAGRYSAGGDAVKVVGSAEGVDTDSKEDPA